MTAELFKRDCVDIARSEYASGRINRRRFLEVCAWAGVAPTLLGAGTAKARANELVIANWGGDAIAAYYDNWGKPFESATGIKVEVDGSGPFEGKIKAMVEKDNVIWDVADTDFFSGIGLGNAGYLEPIDYSVVSKAKVRPGMASKFGICDYTYSFVLAYNASLFGDDPPKGWADMWNLEKYPGKRTMWKYFMGGVEASLIGDGVASDQLYPLDIDRALRKANSLGDNLIYWGSGAESQQMFLDGEVVMGSIWNTRASVLERDTKGKVTWTWDQGVFCPAGWNIPRGNPAGAELANLFIASAQDPLRQIGVLRSLGNGPANPAAIPFIPEDLKRVDPGYPGNYERQIIRSEEWYAENFDSGMGAWLDGISG